MFIIFYRLMKQDRIKSSNTLKIIDNISRAPAMNNIPQKRQQQQQQQCQACSALAPAVAGPASLSSQASHQDIWHTILVRFLLNAMWGSPSE